jgi:hypothetical protein
MIGGFDRMLSSADDIDDYGGEVEDDHNPEEEDPSEIHMARAELKKLGEYADMLYDRIGEMEGLEGWVASKITKAADYLSSVHHWLDYEQENGDDCGCSHNHEEEYEDEDAENCMSSY